MMAGQCYQADQIVMPGERVKIFCGVPFGILPLYGHTPGQIGIITPDKVAYLADALMSETVMRGAKMPSAVCRADDLKAKASLRALRCDAYVLAHRGVYSDIGDLIEKKISLIFWTGQNWYTIACRGRCPRKNGCARCIGVWTCTARRRSNVRCVSATCVRLLIIWPTAAGL